MRKFAITGKGGTGKTTIAGVLAHYFKNDGYQVLAIDADPDANLAFAIGIPPREIASITPISQHRQLIQKRTGARAGQFGQMFKINPYVKDIPDKYLIRHSSIKLLVLGGAQKGGKGCACPENVFLRHLLSEIILNRDEVIIVDMEAGIEHLGRASAQSIDKMLIIVEPGSRSIATAHAIMKLGREIGIRSFDVIGNKIQGEQQKDWIRSQFPESQVIGMISYSDAIREVDFKSLILIDSIDKKIEAEFKELYLNICHP